MTTNQRTKSQRLVTTTPLTSVGEELKSIKHKISKDLFDGISVRKISSKGELANRVLTISDDLFLLFISHHKVGSKESIKDRFNYQGFKAYSKAVTTLTGRGVQVGSGTYLPFSSNLHIMLRRQPILPRPSITLK